MPSPLYGTSLQAFSCPLTQTMTWISPSLHLPHIHPVTVYSRLSWSYDHAELVDKFSANICLLLDSLLALVSYINIYLLKIPKGFLFSSQNLKAQEILRTSDEHDDPAYFLQFSCTAHTYNIILISFAVQMETTPGTNTSFASCNLPGWQTPLSLLLRCLHLFPSFKGCWGCIQTAGYTLS